MPDEPALDDHQRLEFYLLEARMRIAVRTYDFGPQQKIVLDLILDRSYAREQDRALFPSLDYVVRFTKIARRDVSAVLQKLHNQPGGLGVIDSGPAPEFVSRAHQDPRWYWFLPTPEAWRVGPRVDRGFVAQMHRVLDEIEAGQMWLASPQGGEIAPPTMPGLKDAIAASTRADALQENSPSLLDERTLIERARLALAATDAHEVWGKSPHLRVGKVPTHGESPHTSATCREIPHTSRLYTSRGRERVARHDHVPPMITSNMIHEHEHARGAAEEEDLRHCSTSELEKRLDDEGSFWLSQLEEICGPSEKFRRTWLMRLADRWRSSAYRALGETKRMKLSGEAFRVGPGQCANDLFHRFKGEGRRPSTAAVPTGNPPAGAQQNASGKSLSQQIAESLAQHPTP